MRNRVFSGDACDGVEPEVKAVLVLSERRRHRVHFHSLEMLKYVVWLAVLVEVAYLTPLPHVAIPICPANSRPMYRPDGEPRKCLPHQSNLCLSAVDDKADISSICCWHNQVDYFCCSGVAAAQCPEYNNVTVVIHNTQPIGPNPLKVFHFRKGIEEDIDFTRK